MTQVSKEERNVAGVAAVNAILAAAAERRAAQPA